VKKFICNASSCANLKPATCCFGVTTWQIAEQAEFFSFGTNDLTQMTFGYSRDDVGKFIPIYLAQGILQHDPFEVTAAAPLSPSLI
jgi:hypothetical protein